jgi:hypothetical protein
MQDMSKYDQPLPAERAFVVQLHADADVTKGHIVGRAVHVVSGQAEHFDSLGSLLMFIDHVLTRLHAEPPAEPLNDP